MDNEFKSFDEIKRWSKPRIVITQKIHGSNAQILIYQDEAGALQLKSGSRERWLFPGKTTDNYGFAAFVESHKQEFIDKLGLGRHYGEWAGPGVNSGEGLTVKTFVLFNHGRPYPNGLPPSTVLVPVLYDSNSELEPELSSRPDISADTIVNWVMTKLQLVGSSLAPGFMRPEGIVIELNGKRYKKVFKPEETKWTDPSKVKDPNAVLRKDMDYSHLCQPIRLEKLLSRDESYLRDYPKSLGSIVSAYMDDLAKEDQLPKDPDEAKAVRKNATGQIFRFIKACIEQVQDGKSLV